MFEIRKLIIIILKCVILCMKDMTNRVERKLLHNKVHIYIIQGVSSLHLLTPFTPACNTRLTKN